MILRNKWQDARMTESMDVSSFMQLIYGLLKELRAANQVIDKATTVHKIFTNLPSRLGPFVRQIQNERHLPSLSELFSRLHLEESNLKLRHGANQEESLIMRIRNVVRGGYKNRGAYHGG